MSELISHAAAPGGAFSAETLAIAKRLFPLATCYSALVDEQTIDQSDDEIMAQGFEELSQFLAELTLNLAEMLLADRKITLHTVLRVSMVNDILRKQGFGQYLVTHEKDWIFQTMMSHWESARDAVIHKSRRC